MLKNEKKYFINFIVVFFYIFKFISGNSNCNSYTNITDSKCFNKQLIFNDKKYREGFFSINKDGDLILELISIDDGFKLFYGLRANGTNLFPNEFYELNTGANNVHTCNNNNITESKNMFIYSMNNNIFC